MGAKMQILDCNVGSWRAQAKIRNVGYGKLMALISAVNEQGNNHAESRHTVVFDQEVGITSLEQTASLIRKLLKYRGRSGRQF